MKENSPIRKYTRDFGKLKVKTTLGRLVVLLFGFNGPLRQYFSLYQIVSQTGRPTIWMIVGQGPTALAVGAGGSCLDIFILIYPFPPVSLSLGDGPI